MNATDKGYINTITFIKCLEHFAKWSKTSQENPILLIADNYVSHVSLLAVNNNVLDKSKRNNIQMLSRPHISHKIQPLENIFFQVLKSNL